MKPKKNCCTFLTKKGRVCKKKNVKNGECCSSHLRNICSICTEYVTHQTKLHCNHSFCSKCISTWIHMEDKQTCPMCREFVSYDEQYNAFEYCKKNRMISIVVYYEYHICNQELIDYVEEILNCDDADDYYRNPHMNEDNFPRLSNVFYETSNLDSYYDHVEWNSFINYLKNKPDLYDVFLESNRYTYTHCQKFDENNQGVIRNGISYIYSYKINLI